MPISFGKPKISRLDPEFGKTGIEQPILMPVFKYQLLYVASCASTKKSVCIINYVDN